MGKAWSGYLRLLDKYPIRTAACSTGTLMCIGDVLAQVGVEGRRLGNPHLKYDPVRSARFLGVGFFIVGPMFRVWYRTLDAFFKGTKLAGPKMVFCDQGLFAPVFLASFLAGMGYLRGDTTDMVKNKLRRDYKAVMITNYQIWPAVQIFNFTVVPLQHRVLVINFVAVGWNTYLAWKSEHSKPHETDLEEEEPHVPHVPMLEVAVDDIEHQHYHDISEDTNPADKSSNSETISHTTESLPIKRIEKPYVPISSA